MRSLVTAKLRLELLLGAPVEPRPALLSEAGTTSNYLFEQADLPIVSAWLTSLRERGVLLDFRLGLPSLDDIYAVTVGRPVEHEPALELAAS